MIADFLLPNDFTMTDAFSRLDSHDSHSRRERTATDVSVSSDSTLVDDNDVSSLPCHRAMKGQLTPPLTPASGDLVKPAPQQPAPSTVIHPDTPDDIAEDACLELNERKARSAVRYAIRNCAQLDAYRVRSVVGFGSNGVVLAARHNHQDVAVKIIYKASAAENPASCIAPTAEPTLPNEIAILEVLAKEAPHPNVLAYHTHWDDALHYYLVTELHGKPPAPTEESPEPLCFLNPRLDSTHRIDITTGSSDLWSWSLAMSQRPFTSASIPFSLPHIAYTLNPPPLATARHVFAHLALALNHLHSVGVSHGDVKEENVLLDTLDTSRDRPDVRLCDFGHADAPTKSSPDGPPQIRRYGTQEMTPPELLSNLPTQRAFSHRRARTTTAGSSKAVDPLPADVFALGMVLYALLHGPGVLPLAVQETVRGGRKLVADEWGGYPLGNIRADLDAHGLEVIRWMTMVDPEKRATMADVVAHPWVRDALLL